MKWNTRKIITTAAATAVLLAVSLGITAFAADSSTTAGTTASPQATQNNGSRGKKANPANLTDAQKAALQSAVKTNLQAELAKLVTAKTITQEQADAILSRTKGAMKDSGLTTQQKEAVRAAMGTARSAAVDQLLAKGTITQEQANILKSRPEKGPKGGHPRNGKGSGGSGQED